MVLISDFSSVLEIAFAVNALLYFFELAPASDGRLERQLGNYYSLVKDKVKLTKSTEAFPIGFYLQSTYVPLKLITGLLSLLFSFTAISLLVYCGFVPDAQISEFWISIILGALFFVVPSMAVVIFISASRAIQDVTELMEDKVFNEREKNY